MQEWEEGVPEYFSKDFFPLEQVILHTVTHCPEQWPERKMFDGSKNKKASNSPKQLPAGCTDLNEAHHTQQ